MASLFARVSVAVEQPPGDDGLADEDKRISLDRRHKDLPLSRSYRVRQSDLATVLWLRLERRSQS